MEKVSNNEKYMTYDILENILSFLLGKYHDCNNMIFDSKIFKVNC